MATPRDTTPATTHGWQVFNRNRTIGVSVLPGGAINGFHLDESVRKMSERDLAREVRGIAAVASMRGRLGIREQLDAAAAAEGRAVPLDTYDTLLDGVPTAAEYEQFKQEKLG